MMKIFIDEISDIKSVKKVFMKKRDIMIYDDSWQGVSQQQTEYDVDIVANIIAPQEWNRLVSLERDFGKRYPNLKMKYNLIEFDPNLPLNRMEPNAKLVYDSESTY